MSDFAIVRSLPEWAARFGASARSTLTVGNFDGLHLGHQKILRQVVERARATKTLGVAVTFDPHPLKVLRPAQAPPLVQTLEQRLAGIHSMGLNAAVVLNFDAEFAVLSPEAFAEGVLLKGLGVNTILAGQNFRFGHKQAGDLAMLTTLGKRLGFEVEIVEPAVVAGEVASSTAVRRAILEGRPADAARLLGRPFSLTGQIERGSGRGSTILFPTLNLRPEQELLPKPGVYATEVNVDGKLYGAATNVGFRPTFDGKQLSIESHLFNFSESLKEGRLEVFFRERLRDEQKFSGPEELRKQIALDLERARELVLPVGSPEISQQNVPSEKS